MKVEVNIVTSGRLDLLKECCASVARALGPDMSARVLINGDHPSTATWLSEFGDPRFSWKSVPKESLSNARNRPLDRAAAEIIHYLDDDVVVPEHLFRTTAAYLDRHPDVSIVGGPNLTPPANRWRQKAFGAVMTSFFAAPMVRMRYRATGPDEHSATERNLIFCNLAIRRGAVPARIRLKDGLKSNQENLFLFECQRSGLRAVFLSEAYVYHHRRKTLRAFMQQTFSYGFGRAQQTVQAPRSCHPAFLGPAAALALLLASPFSLGLRAALPGSAAIYGLLAFAGASISDETRRLGILGILAVTALTAVTHAAYGVGFWSGLGWELRRRFFMADRRTATQTSQNY